MNQRPADERSLLRAAWRPGAVVYLGCCLVSLAAGLGSGFVLPRPQPGPAPLMVLQTVAVGQVVFFLLIYPVILLSRARRNDKRKIFPESIIECTTLLAIAAPLLIIAAFLSDATAMDVVRIIILEISFLPVSLACGLWLGRPGARTAVWASMLLSLLALPVVYYIFYDFVPGVNASWLWDFAPTTLVWKNASARGSSWLVSPLWAQFAWLALAAVGFTCHWLFPPREKH